MNINRVVLLALGALVFISPAVQAGEGNFGWIYTLDLQPKGSYEFEQRMQWNHRQEAGRYEDFDMRSEIEYGLSDNLQIAGYVNTNYVNANQNDRFGETAGSRIPESIDTSKSYSKFRYESVAAELIWRITNPYTDWIGIGVYFEPTLGYDNKSFEYRLLLQKNLMDDKLILASNLVFETERDEVARNTATTMIFLAIFTRMSPSTLTSLAPTCTTVPRNGGQLWHGAISSSQGHA